MDQDEPSFVLLDHLKQTFADKLLKLVVYFKLTTNIFYSLATHYYFLLLQESTGLGGSSSVLKKQGVSGQSVAVSRDINITKHNKDFRSLEVSTEPRDISQCALQVSDGDQGGNHGE